MSRFKVWLNGVELANEPIGLIEAELNIERDESTRGIFFQYTSEITFYGDGYNILKTIADSNDDCAQVTCLIQYQCANDLPFDDLFEGIIPVGSDAMDWNLQDCTVATKIEAADFSDFLKRYGDYKVLVQTTGTETFEGTTIDNTTAIVPVTENITDFFPGFFGALTSLDRKTYLFTDLLQHVLSYLTNNGISLDADPMYTTLYKRQELLITFIDPLATADTITITWTNYYGQEYSVTQTIVPGTIQVSVDNLLSKMLHFVDPNLVNQYEGRTNYFEKASSVVTGGANTLFNYLPWRSYAISVNAGAKNASITETQAFQYGLKNLAVSNTTLMLAQDSPMYVTLNQLLLHAVQFHNIGFRAIKSGASYLFQVRKLETLLDDTSTSVVLNKVPDIHFKASGFFSVTNLTTPDGKADNAFKPITWNTSYCFGDNTETVGENYSSQEIFDILNATVEQKQDDRLYFVFLKDGDYTQVEKFGFIVATQNATLANIHGSYYHYNIPYLGPLIAARYNVNAGLKIYTGNIIKSIYDGNTINVMSTCTNCPDANIANANLKNLRRLYTFEYPLTYNQVRDLILNQLNYIFFDDGKIFNRSGFIQKVKVPFADFVAQFDVYGE